MIFVQIFFFVFLSGFSGLRIIFNISSDKCVHLFVPSRSYICFRNEIAQKINPPTLQPSMCIIVNQKQFRLLTNSDLKNGHGRLYRIRYTTEHRAQRCRSLAQMDAYLSIHRRERAKYYWRICDYEKQTKYQRDLLVEQYLFQHNIPRPTTIWLVDVCVCTQTTIIHLKPFQNDDRGSDRTRERYEMTAIRSRGEAKKTCARCTTNSEIDFVFGLRILFLMCIFVCVRISFFPSPVRNGSCFFVFFRCRCCCSLRILFLLLLFLRRY